MKPLEMARPSTTISAVLAILCFGSLFLLANPLNLGAYNPPSGPGGITHIVMFQFKDNVAPDAIAETNRKMLGLKDTCIDPLTQKPYIRALTGGRDSSIEGLQNGISYAFIVEFDSPEKRDYYVKTDPSHKAFLESAGAVLEKAIVVDFSDGVF